MAAAMALGAQGVWTGSIWLLTREADMSPEVTENLLAATLARLRPFAGDDRQAGPPAAHEVDGGVGARRRARSRCPCRCRACSTARRRSRFGRVHAKDFAGSPAGQICGSIDRVRPAKDIVRDMVEQWIDTTERMHSLMENA